MLAGVGNVPFAGWHQCRSWNILHGQYHQRPSGGVVHDRCHAAHLDSTVRLARPPAPSRNHMGWRTSMRQRRWNRCRERCRVTTQRKHPLTSLHPRPQEPRIHRGNCCGGSCEFRQRQLSRLDRNRVGNVEDP